MVGFVTECRRRRFTVKPDTAAFADNLVRQILSELRQLSYLDSKARGIPDIISRSISLLRLPTCLLTVPATVYLGCCGRHFPARLTVDLRVYLGTYIIEIPDIAPSSSAAYGAVQKLWAEQQVLES